MSPTREHLLGYLLGALERTEQEQVEAELEHNPALRAELQRLQDCIGRVGLVCAGPEKEPEHFDPPADLAVRTCRLVAERHERAVVITRQSWGAVSTDGSQRQLTWVNVLTAASVLIAAAALFFPALNHSLGQAEIAYCQNNLRQLGVALHEYSSLRPDGSFPRIEMAGNRSVAGMYAPILLHNQHVDNPRVFLCPSSERSRRGVKLHIPTPEEIDKATGEMLQEYQATIGGDFGYNMGFRRNGEVVAPCNQSRNSYVLLSDAPSDSLPGRRSANHAGVGQNVLCEDGHVKFIKSFPCPQFPDDPFYNLERRVAAGLTCDDHVVGASSDRP
ncbi:MAG TPA: hypothetical protein VFV87_02670 [Pirellulaceae bacterium]|nr:hypothetical protein [Pirellulaceae bacterium]